MTTFNTGWVLANGEEINWVTTNLSDSSTVALIHEDKTIDSYINVKEMQDGKAYYYYSSWQSGGTYLYLKSGSTYYEGLLSDGGTKFKKEDIKRKETSYSSSSSSGSSNYKTEVERTERLQVRVNEDLNRIINEIKKDNNISINRLSEVPNAIQKIKDSRKRWASGTQYTLKGTGTNLVSINISTLNLNFTPRFGFLFFRFEGELWGVPFLSDGNFRKIKTSYSREFKAVQTSDGAYSKTSELEILKGGNEVQRFSEVKWWVVE